MAKRILCRNSPHAAAVALTLAAGAAHAADLIGVVTHNGAPAPQTQVQLKRGETVIGTGTTDSAGRYVLRNIVPDQYTLKCGNGPALTVQIGDGLNSVNCRS